MLLSQRMTRSRNKRIFYTIYSLAFLSTVATLKKRREQTTSFVYFKRVENAWNS